MVYILGGCKTGKLILTFNIPEIKITWCYLSQECICIFKLYQKNQSGLSLQTDFSGDRFCTTCSVIQQLLISAWLFYLFIFLPGILRKPVERISDQKKKNGAEIQLLKTHVLSNHALGLAEVFGRQAWSDGDGS